MKKFNFKKGFMGIFGMTAFLALAMVGGEPLGDGINIWINLILLAVFAGSLYMVGQLSD